MRVIPSRRCITNIGLNAIFNRSTISWNFMCRKIWSYGICTVVTYPLLQVGVDDPALVKAYSDGFFAAIPYKRKLMPHAMEALEYLSGKYRLYILSNGFRELQEQKMRSAGILHYFRKIVLSEDIGAHKPFPAIFNFAMSVTQSEFRTSLMIGDNWKNDVAGARDVGMGQGYYCPDAEPSVLDFQPTFLLRDWKEIKKVL